MKLEIKDLSDNQQEYQKKYSYGHPAQDLDGDDISVELKCPEIVSFYEGHFLNNTFYLLLRPEYLIIQAQAYGNGINQKYACVLSVFDESSKLMNNFNTYHFNIKVDLDL